MRLGVCTGIANAHILADAGYDFIELSVAADLMPDASEAEWRDRLVQIEAMPILPEAFNAFIRTARVVGPNVDLTRLGLYVACALTRAADVGGKMIVFGSGSARNVPDGWPAERANDQITEFLEMCADASDKTGVTVAVEPLCRKECNLINTVQQGAEIVESLNRSGIRLLADTYHMEAENEALSVIAAHSGIISHVHTADTSRFEPGSGSFDYDGLFRVLRLAGYDDRLSIECTWTELSGVNLAKAYRTLSDAYAAAAAP